jgi:signal transduction histidine kinase
MDRPGMHGQDNKSYLKVAVISILIAAVLFLHYFTLPTHAYFHAVYRILFYPPLIMAGFWFGLRGALIVCAAVLVLFSPYVLMWWQGLSLEEFDTLMEGFLYIVAAIIVGFLSEREKKERGARIDAERLAAIGKTVSEVAHEMKTPLMAIGGFTKQVSRALKSGDPNQKKLNIVVKEAARLESMVKEMLDFGKPIDLDLSEENIDEILLRSAEISRPLAKNADVELELEANPNNSSLVMPLDVSRMQQVILNLMANAIQASPAGEKVRAKISTKKNEVILEISDAGLGIDEKDRDNVFRPFFSTKKNGTGLGLPIVKGIVEAHGGQIDFRPNPEKGVTFVLKFPLARS